MITNVEIIQETIEQVVNQKKIELWDQFFSEDYIAHGAPNIGMGFSRDSSGKKHLINYIFPDSPADGKLQVGDELLWVEDAHHRWETYEEIPEGLKGKSYRIGVRRGEKTFEVELIRDYFKGFETNNDQAKADMGDFMTNQFPDLMATIKLILSDGDLVVSLLEYRGTHAKYEREAVWREAWFARLADGKIVESWPIMDLDAYFRHLGYKLVPPKE